MMKRLSSGIILALLLISLISPIINFQLVNASLLGQNNSVSRSKEKHISIQFPNPQVVKIGSYDLLRIENCSYISEPGEPMLPVRCLVFKLPEGSVIANVAVEVKESYLEGSFLVLPVPSPSIVDAPTAGNFSEDPKIYNSASFFPEKSYVCHRTHGLDEETMTRVEYLTVNVFPFRFLPSGRKILRAESATVSVYYVEPETTASPTLLKNLIVTSDALEPYATELATYKNGTGISSRALNLTSVYKSYGGIDRQEQIRNCIKDFVTKYGIIYVTIFGDADQVPVRSVFVNDTESGEPYVPTDLYYSDLDGTWDDNNDGIYGDRRYDDVDGIPDVYVGRIPPSLASYAQSAVNKIKGYQQQFNTAENWTKRVVLAAGTGSGDGFSNPFGIAFPYLKNYTANINANKDVVRLYEVYGNLSTAAMGSEINEGALFANFAGHGDPGMWLFYWVIPGLIWNGYGISDVQGLTNGFKLPVVTTMACSTARFDDQDCIGEWFVLDPDGGAIAYFGSSRIAWGYNDEWIIIGLMGEIDWRIYQNFYEGYSRLGQMWGITAKEYVQNHIWNYRYASMYDVKTLMEFILLGDPTLRIYNNNYPETLQVSEEYPTIQSAINAAYNGDTINVSSGIYYENVAVNKSVSIVGAGASNTIIDGNLTGDAIKITACNVNINGFTIRRSGRAGVNLEASSNNNISLNNIVNNSAYGIWLKHSLNNCITGNNITDNGYYGIWLYDSPDSPSKYNSIVGNNITNHYYGTCLYYSSNNSVVGNNITNNSYYGIELIASSNNSIVGNILVNDGLGVSESYGNLVVDNLVNGKPLVYLEGLSDLEVKAAGQVLLVNCNRIRVENLNLSNASAGLQLLRTNCTIIAGNNITNNLDGIFIHYSSNNSIVGNNVTNNGHGIFLYMSSNYNSIVGNNMANNGYYGIDLTWSSNNSMSRNNINNNEHGIELLYSSDNRLSGNNINNNSYGIWLDESSNNSFHHNNFNDNTRQVIDFILPGRPPSINDWDSGYPSGGNYWSDYNGTDANHDGIGDTPYIIDANNADHYPLMSPWTPVTELASLIVRGLNNVIYYRTYNVTTASWAGWNALPGSTCDSPAAAIIGNELHVVVRSSSGTQLYHGYVNLVGGGFSGWALLSGSSPSAPTLTSNGTHLCLVVGGGDSRIYHRLYNVASHSWSGWSVLPSGSTGDSPSAALLGNELHIVVRGMSGTQLYYSHRNLDTAAFSGWTLLSGSTPSSPTLASNSTHLSLVVRGGNNRIYYRFCNAATHTWGSWSVLPSGSTGDRQAAAFTSDKLQFVVRGSTGAQLYHCNIDLASAAFSGWSLISGTTPSPPTLAS